MNDEYRVLLPSWLMKLKQRDKEHFKQSVVKYVANGRPEYNVIAVRGKFAICKRAR